jgi:hypothetical protein
MITHVRDAVPLLALVNIKKTLTAGFGACRVRVTVLGGVTLTLRAGQAVALTGALPMARSMLCAIAAGVARADAGRVRWGTTAHRGVRYAALGDAPRVLQRRTDAIGSVVVLDSALIDGAPEPDLPAVVALLRPWLEAGGAALVSVPAVTDRWPWLVRELVGGQLRDPRAASIALAHAQHSPVRAVAEGLSTRPPMADPAVRQ